MRQFISPIVGTMGPSRGVCNANLGQRNASQIDTSSILFLNQSPYHQIWVTLPKEIQVEPNQFETVCHLV